MAGPSGISFYCSLCSKEFKTKQGMYQHYLVHEQHAANVAASTPPMTISTEDGQIRCGACSKSFVSQYAFNSHFLACGSPRLVTQQQEQTTMNAAKAPGAVQGPPTYQARVVVQAAPTVQGAGPHDNAFTSAPPAMTPKESLHSPPGTSQEVGWNLNPISSKSPLVHPTQVAMTSTSGPTSSLVSVPRPVSQFIPDPAPVMDDDAQANDICMKMRRLLLQADLTISLEGYITYGGGDWKRVPVVKQQELYGQFSALCHLPEHLQLTEHLPSVTAFSLSDADYPFEEFQLSPKKSQSHRTVPIVAISCIKVTLMDSCEDVVKIAALDVTTGRVLMHYFVCTNTEAAVKDWRVSTTGMESFDDMERFRQLGYKVLRGWSAARATLWQFIDNESILVGHDLRNDLDALRMIHGRGVDVAKSVELAANGPLSKQQLSLDSLSRDILKQPLVSHPSGRDALLDAFAIRELALHIIKNAGGIKAWARGQSLAYQRVVPTARA